MLTEIKKNLYDRQQQKTTTELLNPDLQQTHKQFGEDNVFKCVKMYSEIYELFDSLMIKFQENRSVPCVQWFAVLFIT